MRRTISLILLLLMSGICTSAAPRKPWLYAKSDNFEMLSSTSLKESKKLLADFEEFHALLKHFFGSPRLAEKRTTIVVFEFDEDFTPYKPLDVTGRPQNLAAYYLENQDAAYIAMVSGPATERDVREVVYHEYVHQFFHMMEYDLPVWLNEGLADVLSTMRVKKKFLEFGYYKESYLDYLTRYGIHLSPLSWLFSVERGSAHYQHGALQAKFYAQSWLVVHYWMCNPEMFDGYLRYLELWEHSDLTSLEAMEQAFGMNEEQMKKALEDYLKRGKYPSQRLPLGTRPKRVSHSFRKATPFEVDMGLENLHVRAVSPGDGEIRFIDLADRYPESSRPFETLAVLADSRNEAGSAKKYFKKAISLGSKNSYVHVAYARLELDEIDVESSLDFRLPDETTAHLRKSLNLAIQSNPYHTQSLNYLAYLESIARKPRIKNIETVQRMVGGMRDQREVLLSLAVIRWRLNDIETSRIILEALKRKKPLKGESKRRLELLEKRLDRMEKEMGA